MMCNELENQQINFCHHITDTVFQQINYLSPYWIKVIK